LLLAKFYIRFIGKCKADGYAPAIYSSLL
jgi:hypothetical protein